MDEIKERLIEYMGEHDLTIKDVAKMVNRTPLTVWNFLRGKTKPHDQTLYRFKKLIGEDRGQAEARG